MKLTSTNRLITYKESGLRPKAYYSPTWPSRLCVFVLAIAQTRIVTQEPHIDLLLHVSPVFHPCFATVRQRNATQGTKETRTLSSTRLPSVDVPTREKLFVLLVQSPHLFFVCFHYFYLLSFADGISSVASFARPHLKWGF